MSPRSITVFALLISCAAFIPHNGRAQDVWEMYCNFGSGGCGYPGNQQPMAETPSGVQEGDLAARRYGAASAEFQQKLEAERKDVQQLGEALKDLSSSPYGLESDAVGKEIVKYFEEPSLPAELAAKYTSPTDPPSGGLPPVADRIVKQLWDRAGDRTEKGIIQTAILVTGAQRQSRAYRELGGQFAEVADYMDAELERNFVDARGLLRVLGNENLFEDVIIAPVSGQLRSRIVGGINKAIIADYVGRLNAGGDDAVARIDVAMLAQAKAYAVAAGLAALDPTGAIGLLESLDAQTRIVESFVNGFVEVGFNSAASLVEAICSPIETGSALIRAIERYDETAALVKAAIVTKYGEFVAGDANKKAEIIGGISFEVVGVFLGPAAIKYSADVLRKVGQAARVVVVGEIAAVTRGVQLGGLSESAASGLKALEAIDPDAALRLYMESKDVAARVGEQLDTFRRSSSVRNPIVRGEDFLRADAGRTGEVANKLGEMYKTFDSGGKVDVFLAVKEEFAQELLENGLKGPQYKAWAESMAGREIDRFGVGRYVSTVKEGAMKEAVEFNAETHVVVQGKFSPVSNNGSGYVIFPSVRHPGGFNIFDPTFDDFGAFTDLTISP